MHSRRLLKLTGLALSAWVNISCSGEPSRSTNREGQVGDVKLALLTKGSPGAMNGDAHYCDGSVKCESGEGSCDTDTDCVLGQQLVCGVGKGSQFGIPGNVCVPTHCTNRLLDADETSKDCGGSCGTQCYVSTIVCRVDEPCAVGQGDCDNNAECQPDLVCRHPGGRQYGAPGDVCVPEHCTDGIVNNGETQLNCGGACGTICNATCWNGTQDPGETGVDCGGNGCKRCDGPQDGPLVLASAHVAKIKISVSPNASPQVVAAARMLQRKLNAITQADFTLVYDGSRGIRLGVPGDFAEWPYGTSGTAQAFTSSSLFDSQDYLIRSIPGWGTLALAGPTPNAVENAVWGFLEELGYRHYMPSPIWEVTPRIDELIANLDKREHPAFTQRGIQYSSRAWPLAEDPTLDPYSGTPYVTPADCVSRRADGTVSRLSYDSCALDLWRRRNRMTSGSLDAGATYDNVAAWAASTKGIDRAVLWPGDQPCLTAQQTLNGVTHTVESLTQAFAANFAASRSSPRVLAMEGGDDTAGAAPWCAGDGAAGLSKSDVAVRVANAAAQAFAASDRIVMRAYSTHAEPPSVQIDGRVFVQLYQSTPLQSLIEGWKAQYQTPDPNRIFGVRTTFASPSQLPGTSAALPSALPSIIRGFFAQRLTGIYQVETLPGALSGYGEWLTSRLLWDPFVSPNALRSDFLSHAFGPAQNAMAKFYSYVESPTLSTHWIASAYHRLSDARNAVDSSALPTEEKAAILRRIRDLAIYVRYLELRRGLLSDCIYQNVQMPGSPLVSVQERRDSLAQLLYATRTSWMLPSFEFVNDPCHSYLSGVDCEPPTESELAQIKTAANASPVTSSQIDAWIAAGMLNELHYTDPNGVDHILPVDREDDFSAESLVPANAPEPPDRQGNANNENGGLQASLRVVEDSDSAANRWYVWPSEGNLSPLLVTGCFGCGPVDANSTCNIDARSGNGFSARFSAAARIPGVAAPFWQAAAPPVLTTQTQYAVDVPPPFPDRVYALDVIGGGVDFVRTCTSDPCGGDANAGLNGGNASTCPVRMVRLATTTDRPKFTNSYLMLFDVPRGTRSIAGHAEGMSEVYRWYKYTDNDWARACIRVAPYTASQCEDVAEHFVIPNQVELEGCDPAIGFSGSRVRTWPGVQPTPEAPRTLLNQSQLWRTGSGTTGRIVLITVPPVLARHPREFLLPPEAVDASLGP